VRGNQNRAIPEDAIDGDHGVLSGAELILGLVSVYVSLIPIAQGQ
jgi:hypothetical protein